MPPVTSTWGIAPPVRSKLRGFILELRTALEEDADRQLAAVGLGQRQAGEVPGGRSLGSDEDRLRRVAQTVIDRSMEAGDDYVSARTAFIREAAYTLLDRAVAFRCLEERGQLLVDGQPETLVKRDAGGSASLLWRLRQKQPDLTARELAQAGYRRACQAMSERIKVLFDPDAEHAAFFPLQATWDRLVAVLNDSHIPPASYAEDEVLGWVYQYWNSTEKDRVYAKLGKGGKIETPGELSAASCLYTERYIVDYLVQNTLGALWTESHPESKLPESWPYFIRPTEGNPPAEREPKRVRDIRLLDPACGSGHFLVRAFDLFSQLYAEEGIEDPIEVPVLILEHNLYGIDIDRRAIQIAALALYLKGCEVSGPEFRPRKLNLVAADLDLPSAPPAAFLERFSDQPELTDLAKSLWTGLAGVQTFGSLLHPEREIDQTFQRLRDKQRGTLWTSDAAEWANRRRQLISGLRQAIDAEAESPNLGRHLFGTHARHALDLVQILGLRYDVCVANPPYARTRNLPLSLSSLLSSDYELGKQDLYTAFILRCLEFAGTDGYVGMVTLEGWIYQAPLLKLRELLLRGGLQTVAHLSHGAFEEISGAVVSVACFTVTPTRVSSVDIFGVRVATGSAVNKAFRLSSAAGERWARTLLLSLPGYPVLPDAPLRLVELLAGQRTIDDVCTLEDGVWGGDNERDTRWLWEARPSEIRAEGPFRLLSAGKGYGRWYRETRQVTSLEGRRRSKGSRWEYSRVALGRLYARLEPAQNSHLAGVVGIYSRRNVEDDAFLAVGPLLNSRIGLAYLRTLSSGVNFNPGYCKRLPLPKEASAADIAKNAVVAVDLSCVAHPEISDQRAAGTDRAAALLHTIEAMLDRRLHDAYGLSSSELDERIAPPRGLNPLLAGYDALPEAPEGIAIPEGLVGFLDTLEHRQLSASELQAEKARLRAAYEAGPGAKLDEDESASKGDGEDGAAPGARIPIPTETFIEELADKLAIHPISVYWLLEELKAEGVVSPPLRKAELTDYVSVSLLRMLGYRWPEQDAYEAEHGPILDPDLVDQDGIIPLVPCANQPTAETRIRTRLEGQSGTNGAADFLADFRRYVGRELDAWLTRDFFKAHTSQFKSRPIAWHLRSPEGHFAALVLYHRLSRETLGRLRSQYAGDRIAALRNEQDRARSRGDTAKVSELAAAIEDVELFRAKIEAIERGDSLTDRIRCRWKDDEAAGRPGPYSPDIDDGVKVNIRPFQENGLLPSKVISKW